MELESLIVLSVRSTSARLVLPCAHDFEIASAIIWAATKLGAPNGVVLPYRFVKVPTNGFAILSAYTSGPKNEMYAPGNLKLVSSRLPSVAKKMPLYPAPLSCSAKCWGSDAT